MKDIGKYGDNCPVCNHTMRKLRERESVRIGMCYICRRNVPSHIPEEQHLKYSKRIKIC